MAMRATIRWTWAAMLVLAMGTAQAQRVEGSRASAQGAYDAEVSVRSQSAAERNNGFSRGLIQVLSKLTGERAPQQRPGVGDEVRNAKELSAKATAEIAHAKKFWSVWNEFSRESKLNTFAIRAREIKAKAEELQRGRFEAQFDYSAIVMLYVTAIRQLGGKHSAL